MKLNILLVEDDRSVRFVLAYILSTLNHCVVEVESIGQAKMCLAGAKFDLVISDLHLRDGLGTDFLNEAAQTRPEMRQMLISAGKDPGGHGAYYQKKPFDPPAIQAAIEAIFQTAPR